MKRLLFAFSIFSKQSKQITDKNHKDIKNPCVVFSFYQYFYGSSYFVSYFIISLPSSPLQLLHTAISEANNNVYIERDWAVYF